MTPDYLGTILDMTPRAARSNVLRGLKATNLVDEEGKPTPRASRWRDDEEYAAVCQEIREEVYPEELLHAYPTAEDIDRARLQRWFQQKTGLGEVSARKMASFFELLTEADVSKQDGNTSRTTNPAPKRQRRTTKTTTKDEPSAPNGQEAPLAETVDATRVISRRQPSLHIDIQIHISPESSANQIDQIFKSMAKHLNLSDEPDDE